MGKRGHDEKRAIDESVELNEARAEKHRKFAGVHEHFVDQELFEFFSGGYAAELGLRSTFGTALDRAAFQMGPSQGRTHDGYNNAVRFGVQGPSGLLDVTRVARALSVLAGPAPEGDADWDDYLPALAAYYSPPPGRGVHEGLLFFAEFAAVVTVLPESQRMARAYCRDQCEKELAANLAAIAQSHAEHAEDLVAMREELGTARNHFRRAALERRLGEAAAAATVRHPQLDTEALIKRRWARVTPARTVDALRALTRRAGATREAEERAQARELQVNLLGAARSLWGAARAAYQAERRRVDQQIRADQKGQRRAQDQLDELRARTQPGDVTSDQD